MVDQVSPPKGTWRDWSEVPGNKATQAPVAAAELQGKIYLFGSFPEEYAHIEHCIYQNGKWSQWSSAPPKSPNQTSSSKRTELPELIGGETITVVPLTNSKLFTATTEEMYVGQGPATRTEISVAWLDEWPLLRVQATDTGTIKGIPATAAPCGTKLHCFYITPGQTIRQSILTGYPTGSYVWTYSWDLPSAASSNLSIAATSSEDTIYLFYCDSDESLRCVEIDQTLAMSFLDAPDTLPPSNGVTASFFQGALHIVLKGVDRKLYYSASNEHWENALPWKEISGGQQASQAPTLIPFGTNLYLFNVGPDGKILYNVLDF